MTGLRDRSAFVTGTAQGVGRAIAAGLHARGMRVAMADRDEAANRDAARELDPAGDRVLALELDVRDPEACEAAFAAAVERWGSVDLLVNNAAVTDGASLWELGIERWDDVLATNLRSTFVLGRAAGAHMRERGFGRIVNMSSLAAQAARPSGAAYSASKAGIVALTRVLAQDLAPHGVTVNAIAPGVIDTPMVQTIDSETLGRLVAAIPVGRIADPAEIASLVAFLASEEAGFITGATYDINGGTSMR